jgi:hypothetical protein
VHVGRGQPDLRFGFALQQILPRRFARDCRIGLSHVRPCSDGGVGRRAGGRRRSQPAAREIFEGFAQQQRLVWRQADGTPQGRGRLVGLNALAPDLNLGQLRLEPRGVPIDLRRRALGHTRGDQAGCLRAGGRHSLLHVEVMDRRQKPGGQNSHGDGDDAGAIVRRGRCRLDVARGDGDASGPREQIERHQETNARLVIGAVDLIAALEGHGRVRAPAGLVAIATREIHTQARGLDLRRSLQRERHEFVDRSPARRIDVDPRRGRALPRAWRLRG